MTVPPPPPKESDKDMAERLVVEYPLGLAMISYLIAGCGGNEKLARLAIDAQTPVAHILKITAPTLVPIVLEEFKKCMSSKHGM